MNNIEIIKQCLTNFLPEYGVNVCDECNRIMLIRECDHITRFVADKELVKSLDNLVDAISPVSQPFVE